MEIPQGQGVLPGFLALETLPVLWGCKSGASIQLGDDYYEGIAKSLNALDHDMTDRRQIISESRKIWNDLQININQIEGTVLFQKSTRLRNVFQQMPEVRYIESAFPGESFVVPEWARNDDGIKYGPRLYFFRKDNSSSPSEILRHNINAITDDTIEEFKRYQGHLHGYPDCCIEYFNEHLNDAPPPEWRSVEPLVSQLHSEALNSGQNLSLDDLLPDFFDYEYGYAFFSRKFFPHPNCDRAQNHGSEIYGELTDEIPDSLVDDYFRLNYLDCYKTARVVKQGAEYRTTPGEFGIEHLSFSLPFTSLLSLSRYEETKANEPK